MTILSLRFAFPLLLVLLFGAGCGGSDPFDPNDPDNRLKGKMNGEVQLFGDCNEVVDPSGVTVTLEGTSYSAVTDANGIWSISDLPAGTYDLMYSRDGYTRQKSCCFQFVGGGTAVAPYPYTYVSLGKLVGNTIEDCSAGEFFDAYVIVQDTVVSPHSPGGVQIIQDTVSGTNTTLNFLEFRFTGELPECGQYVTIFFGRDDAVSSTPGRWEKMLRMNFQQNDVRIVHLAEIAKNQGFVEGDELYLALYPGNYRSYRDPETGDQVYDLNYTDATKSEVVSFTVR